MELTGAQQDKVIDLYVNQRMRISPVVYEMMRETGLRWKDLYAPVSDLLTSKKIIRRGRGTTFASKDFRWKVKCCAVCQKEFQPTNSAQRFCELCAENAGMVIGYGITAADYRAFFEEQRGLCGVCGLDMSKIARRRVHLDHCHRTGRVRGIVCSVCNQRLAAMDDEGWVEKARTYLARPGLVPRCECTNTRKLKDGRCESTDGTVVQLSSQAAVAD
jgi:hypothetical protein